MSRYFELPEQTPRGASLVSNTGSAIGPVRFHSTSFGVIIFYDVDRGKEGSFRDVIGFKKGPWYLPNNDDMCCMEYDRVERSLRERIRSIFRKEGILNVNFRTR